MTEHFNARWEPTSLVALDDDAAHLITAVMWHHRRVNDPPHLRCVMLVTMDDGVRAFATLDVRADSFDALPHAPDTSVSRESLIGYAGPSLIQWLDSHVAPPTG